MKKALIILMAMMIMMIKEPMVTLILLITMSMILSMSIFFHTLSYWTVFLLILTFISGMMILFMYVISLNPNQKFLMSKKMKTMIMSMLLVCWMPLSVKDLSTKETIKSNFSTSLMSMFLLLTLITIMIFPP